MRGRWAVHLVVLLGLASCTRPYWERRSGAQLGDVDAKAKVIKLHLASGEVYVLSPWRFSPRTGTVSGEGELVSLDRSAGRRGFFRVPLSLVVAFETNTRRELASYVVVTTISLALVLDAVLINFVSSLPNQGAR